MGGEALYSRLVCCWNLWLCRHGCWLEAAIKFDAANFKGAKFLSEKGKKTALSRAGSEGAPGHNKWGATKS
jgi:hypothetical protein